MARLHIEVSSDKSKRLRGMGGDTFVACRITDGSRIVASLEYREGAIALTNVYEGTPIAINGYRVQ